MSCGSAYVFSCHKNTPLMLLFCICTCNYLHQKVEKRNINTILAVSNLPITYVRTSKIYFILTYSSEIRGLCSMNSSSKTLQNLLYQKTHIFFFISCNFSFGLCTNSRNGKICRKIMFKDLVLCTRTKLYLNNKKEVICVFYIIVYWLNSNT